MIKEGQQRGFNVKLESPGLLWIIFNEPDRLNGMTSAIKRDLLETITQAQMDNRVRVVIFTGEGKAFSAGDDLKAYATGFQDQDGLVPPLAPGHDSGIGTYNGLRWVSQPVNSAIRKLDKLTICAMNGIAIQTGFSLALACDFRLAAKSARMGSATLRFALLPDEGGQWLLVQLLGAARTMDFLMRKRIVSADEAWNLGLINEVVDDKALAGRAKDLATELANGPQVAMRMLKQSIYRAAELNMDASMDEIAAKTAIVDHHPDVIEGKRAFTDKITPKFNRWLEEE